MKRFRIQNLDVTYMMLMQNQMQLGAMSPTQSQSGHQT